MSKLIEIFKFFFPVFKSQHDIEEAFLSESTEIYDLERRMRLNDNAARYGACGLVYGTMMR